MNCIIYAIQPQKFHSNSILRWWEFAKMAYKWNIGGKRTKMSKMAKTQSKCGIVLSTQFNSQNPTQNPFYDGESLPKWHANGKLAENKENVEGGRNVKYNCRIVLFIQFSPKIPLLNILQCWERVYNGTIMDCLAENKWKKCRRWQKRKVKL